MGEKTWLYIYEGKPSDNKSNNNSACGDLYIGIGKDMKRVFQKHNNDAEKLRDTAGTVILQTIKPFSSREDALKAEAIAIHIASLVGRKPIYDPEHRHELFGNDQSQVKNRQGVISTKHLGPAIYTREGEVNYKELQNAIIVPIAPTDIEGRTGVWGDRSGEEYAERAESWWGIVPEVRPKIKHVIAVLTGPRNIILGSWEVDPQLEWELNSETPAGKEKRVKIPIVDRKNHDFRHMRGKLFIGQLNSSPIYSDDIRQSRKNETP